MRTVFAIMPFGIQASHRNRRLKIDFDSIYKKAIQPACIEMGLQIIRADEEITGGIIHTLMFERLVCSDIAIVDMSNQNANVCYELGFRHCARENHTIIIFDKDSKLPFDFSFERAIPYELNSGELSDENAQILKEEIKKRLVKINESDSVKDSPAFELIEDFPRTELCEARLNIYKKKQANYEKVIQDIKNASCKEEIDLCFNNIKEHGLSIKSLAFYIIENFKERKEWSNIIEFINNVLFIEGIKDVYYKQQLALAYNKRGDGTDRMLAKDVIEESLLKDGKSSETYGILGSIYKSLYEAESNPKAKNSYLSLSIQAYREGFNSDITDYYPGINLATLLFKKYAITQQESLINKMEKVLGVVEYDLLLHSDENDYWYLATLYEIEVLYKRFSVLSEIINKICLLDIQNKIQPWQKESTLKNLTYIKNIYSKNCIDTDWYNEFKDKLSLKGVEYVLD